MTAIYETHMHTPLCGHAVGEVEEYAAEAARRGLGGIIVTCHNPLPDGFAASVRMREDQFQLYLDMIERAREAFAGRVDVRLGLECDYLPQYEDYLAKQVRRAPFDYVIGSVHPQLSDWQRLYAPAGASDPAALQRAYFDHLARAAETKLFDAISHPDLVKNLTPGSWDVRAIEGVIGACLDRIATAGCAMELNTSGVNKAVAEMNPGLPMLRMMRERNIAVVVGSDAHEPRRVGDGFSAAYELLAEAGYKRVCQVLGRQRQWVQLSAARAALHGR